MKTGEGIAIAGNGLTYLLTIVQSNPIFQYIELAFSIAVSVVLLAYRLWKWWKEAKKDGKITKEEIQDGIDTFMDGVDEIKDKTKKKGE